MRKLTKPKKSSITLAKNTTIDNKLTATTIHLECLFDRGVNFKDRIITWSSDIEEPMFSVIDSAISEMERDSKAAITLRIHSGGGSVYEALAVIGRMEKTKCPIIVECYGHVMSAATAILACGSKRRISRRAWFMHHECSYSVEGRHSDNMEAIKQYQREEEQWISIMAEHSNKSKAFWSKKGLKTDSYFTPKELLKMGVVDEVF